MDFQGDINHSLGINFNCYKDEEDHVAVHMSQQNDALELIKKAHPVNSIPDIDMPIDDRQASQQNSPRIYRVPELA